MRLQLSTGFLASLAAAGALVGGVLLAPVNSAAQDQGAQQGGQITITGTCVNPDGSPATKMPVEITAPRKGGVNQDEAAGGEGPGDPGLLQQGGGKSKSRSAFETLATGMTDDSGRFSLKFKPIGKVVTLAVGDPSKSAWAKKTVNTEGKDVDVGNIQLKPQGSN